MSRRRRVLQVSLALLGGLSLLAVGVGTVLTRSAWGQAFVQRQVEAAIRDALGDRSRLELHGLRLLPIGSLSADSLTWRDTSGTRVASGGALRISIALAPLLDREVQIREITWASPRVALVQDAQGAWNIAAMVPPSDTTAPPASPWRIRVESLTVTDGALTVTRPDSAPSLPPVRTTVDGIQVALGPTQYQTGDGRGAVSVRHLALRSDNPPLQLRNAEGMLQLHRDSVGLDLTHIAVGNTRLALRGAIGFPRGDEDPALDLTLRADTVDLADLAWASDLVPREASGRAVVRISNGPARGIVRYRVSDVVLTGYDSDLRGALIADVGEDVAIRDLDIQAAPLDFRLLHGVFGDSMPPAPWDGRVRGRLRTSGGPLSRWRLDPTTLEFEDRRVGAARSRLTVSGLLDLEAEETRLLPLDVRVDSLDVRTAGGVTDVADSLRGYLAGRVRLDGPISDLRFSELDLVHVDGNLPRSHVRGAGRIAEDTTRTWLEARLTLDTVGVAALGRAFTPEVLAGRMHGTLDVSAVRDSVALALVLSGDAGDLSFTGATSLDTARLVLKGQLGVWEMDLRGILPELALPAHSITAVAELGLDGAWDAPSGPVAFTLDSTSSLARIRLRDGRGSLALEPGGIRVDTLALRGPVGELSVRGRLSRDPALRDTLRFVARVDSAARLAGLLGDSLAEAWADSLRGRAELTGVALGSFDTLDVQALLVADSLQAGSYGVRRIDAELLLAGLPKATRGLVTFDASDIAGAGIPIHRLSSEATVREAAWADASLRMLAGDTLVASARADLHYMGDSIAVRLDSLDARLRDVRWSLLRPTALFTGPDRITLDTLELRSGDGARLSVDGRLLGKNDVYLRAVADRVPLAHARFTGYMPSRVNGLLTLDAELSGTTAKPSLTLSAALDSTTVDELAAPSLTMTATYAERLAAVTMRSSLRDRDAFSLTAELPMDLALEGKPLTQRLIEDPLYVRVVADGSPLGGLEALMPGVRNLQGAYDADVQVTGTWKTLEPRGILLVRDGAFGIPALGTRFREFDMDVGFAPDSILVYRARLADDRSQNDTAYVSGAIVRTRDSWRTDITTIARQLRVIDDPRVAEADASWNLRLSGPLDSLRLGGEVFIPQGNVFIGRQERRVLQLEEDLAADSAVSRYAPTLENLRLRLGNEVRLRSPEANVQLTGEIAVTGTLDAPDVRGEIFASRGSYRLDLGLLERTFQVDSGLVRMNGPLSIPPTLDIHASYVVRQAEKEDVHINARLSGDIEQPRLQLSSADLGTTASDTEIISYLLFGAPTFALDGQNSSAVRLAASALVPALGGAAERALGARLPFLSELQVVTLPGDTPQDFTLNSFEGLLNRYAIQAGTQLGTDSYLRVSGGVCRGENRAAQSLPAWFGIVGEYRPRERLSAELSLTPGSSPCSRIGTFSQIYQIGLDLFRDWRW